MSAQVSILPLRRLRSNANPVRISTAERDRLAVLLQRLEDAPACARIGVRQSPDVVRPVHLLIDAERHALTRAEADDLAAALFADPGVMPGGAGLAAWLVAAARDTVGAGQGAANDNAALPDRPVRTGLSGLWLGVFVSLAYLAVVASTWLEVNP